MTEAQKPAYGVSENKEYPGMKSFTVSCECGSTEHAITTWIEIDADKECKQLEISHWIECFQPTFKRSRWKAIWDLLWKGYSLEQHGIILTEQVARNWIAATEEAIKYINENEKK